MTIESRKRALYTFFAKVVDRLGYKFTPDEELRDFLLEQEVLLEQKHGIPFCPCQPSPASGRRHDARVSVHPFHRTHYDAMKRCWCGLSSTRTSRPDALPQIPFSE